MSQLPSSARAVEHAVIAAVSAAATRDAALFAGETERLAALEPERVRLVLGGVLSSLLEARLPDGLAADDLRDLIERCVRTASVWFPAVDAAAFIVVLTDALGVQREDEPIDLSHLTVVQHGALLIADLLPTPAALRTHLTKTFAEIHRHQTVELP